MLATAIERHMYCNVRLNKPKAFFLIKKRNSETVKKNTVLLYRTDG